MYKNEIHYPTADRPISLNKAASLRNIEPQKLAEMLRENGKKIFKKLNPLPHEIDLMLCMKNDVESLFKKLRNPNKQ